MTKHQDQVTKYISLRPKYLQLAQKISIIIQEVLEIEGINYHAVTHRAKEIDSFSQKIENPKYDNPFEQITDFAGIRVIAYVEDDVVKIGKLLENLFTIDRKNSLDKSKDLGIDKVGYKSVHYICELPKSRTILLEYSRFKELKFEIQVRTILQHSWAEIEHDKNYKFAGELPSEIKRRFKLLAGSLEIADREFNQLAKEIDNYSKQVKEKTKQGNLNIPINSTSLRQFLSTKFEKEISKGKLTPDFASTSHESRIIRELRNFGLITLNDLNEIIPKDINKQMDNENFLGILRDILLIKDFKKYFDKSYEGDWGGFDGHDSFFFSHYDLDLELLVKELNKKRKK